jgi:hypothetical protein
MRCVCLALRMSCYSNHHKHIPSPSSRTWSTPPISLNLPATNQHSSRLYTTPSSRALVILHCIMAIPRELRDLIYNYVIDDLPKIIDVSNDRALAPVFQLQPQGSSQTVVGGSTNSGLVTFLPGIAYVNDVVYGEFVPTYLQRIYLNIGATPDLLYLENFFETLPKGDG